MHRWAGVAFVAAVIVIAGCGNDDKVNLSKPLSSSAAVAKAEDIATDVVRPGLMSYDLWTACLPAPCLQELSRYVVASEQVHNAFRTLLGRRFKNLPAGYAEDLQNLDTAAVVFSESATEMLGCYDAGGGDHCYDPDATEWADMFGRALVRWPG